MYLTTSSYTLCPLKTLSHESVLLVAEIHSPRLARIRLGWVMNTGYW